MLYNFSILRPQTIGNCCCRSIDGRQQAASSTPLTDASDLHSPGATQTESLPQLGQMIPPQRTLLRPHRITTNATKTSFLIIMVRALVGAGNQSAAVLSEIGSPTRPAIRVSKASRQGARKLRPQLAYLSSVYYKIDLL
jgi:hypothetical protein